MEPEDPQHPWRGAWARRQAEKAAAKEQEKDEVRKEGKIPVPPIPDLRCVDLAVLSSTDLTLSPHLRFEQGVLLSIRPFLHRVEVPAIPTIDAAAAAEDLEHPQHDEKVEAGEKGALVSTALTAEGAEQGLLKGETSDIFSGALRIEWGQLSYVIVRDQVSSLSSFAFSLVADVASRVVRLPSTARTAVGSRIAMAWLTVELEQGSAGSEGGRSASANGARLAIKAGHYVTFDELVSCPAPLSPSSSAR